ncbi:hypothetical protein VST7929_03197 [Vibrio stylophorae]|uniref:Uncharacterized protein n=1 Tax=Vibrio stylophorae TaxID=659351 RepID=A0ABM8ZYA1_9VIBR|nr:hypothetical protein [Vibrio stylophorae]CAH0535723.1 hypothetical protein VST7929_03197 [Vibrio stylophorae]
MKDPDIEIRKWKLEREKGCLLFVLQFSIPALIGIILAKAIEPLLSPDKTWGWLQTNDLLLSLFGGSVFVFPVSYAIWWWRERKYKRHMASIERRT